MHSSRLSERQDKFKQAINYNFLNRTSIKNSACMKVPVMTKSQNSSQERIGGHMHLKQEASLHQNGPLKKTF